MRRNRARARIAILAASAALVAAAAACSWDPSRPFDREVPEVKQALGALDAGDANAAAGSLEDYLATGTCKEGKIGTPPKVRARPNGTFDLGLALFRIGEAYGKRFGDEEVDAGANGEAPAAKEKRAQEIECALSVVREIAADDTVPLDVRARARYLEGNLLFLSSRYEEAVAAYDKALVLAPGYPDAGDPVGRDAAWNRAIALRRIEDQKNKDAGADSGKGDGGGDGGNDAGGDGGGDGGKNDDKGDAGNKGNDKDKNKNKNDAGASPDAGPDSGPPPQPQPNEPDGGGQPPPPPPDNQSSQDERMLDQLEKAPTVQQEAARKAASQRRVRGMADK